MYRQVVEHQIYGGDIDSFALSLAAIRLFLLSEEAVEARPHLYVHDMLLHSPERQGELFTEAERVTGVDPAVDDLSEIDTIEFDAIVGNPPYGARKPAYKKGVYGRLFGQRDGDRRAGSIATGDSDTYAMFFANGIERLREGGRLCLITNDSFRTLTTHAALRRHILDRCKIIEILLTDTRHFEGVSFQFAGMAITTLEKCSDGAARRDHVMRLVDYIREPANFASAPPEKVNELRQEEYEALPETPFFVGVPREVFAAAKASVRIGDVARGRQGLATADDARFLAGIDDLRVGGAGIASVLSESEQAGGIQALKPHWVPFAKGGGFGDYCAIFVEDETQNELFLLAYLNSALATYFMKKLVNATATADVGYIEKLPYRRPSAELEAAVVGRVENVVAALQADTEADISTLRDEIDEAIFDLFEIGPSREEIRRFYRTVGRVEADDQAASE